MTEGQLSTLDARALSERLRALAGEERNVQAEFLLHLDALDRRRGYADLGYPSLWEYCLRALHLREGAAGRRIGAMRVLRRFPSLVDAVRDGRLCLSTLCVLGPVLTPDNVEEVAARAAFRTKAETDTIAASLKPRPAPADGIRRLPGVQQAAHSSTPMRLGPAASAPSMTENGPEQREPPNADRAASELAPHVAPSSTENGELASLEEPGRRAERAESLRLDAPPPPRRAAAELLAVSEAQWSLRVTLETTRRGATSRRSPSCSVTRSRTETWLPSSRRRSAVRSRSTVSGAVRWCQRGSGRHRIGSSRISPRRTPHPNVGRAASRPRHGAPRDRPT